MDNNSNGCRGLGVLSVLQIIFIVLKLCHLITWPWMIVLIPLWISLALIYLILLVLLIIVTIGGWK